MGDVKFGFFAKDIIRKQRVSEKDIEMIRNFVETQKLPNLTDEQLIVFLLSCQNDQEATRKTILAYYSIKKKSPELFDNWNIERDDLQHQLQIIRICVLPKRTKDGSVIIYYKIYDSTYSNYIMGPALKLFLMAIDIAIYDDPPTDLVILLDMKGVGLMHLTRMRLDMIRTLFFYLQEALPVKLKCIHILNSVYFINKLLAIIKPFIKAELFEHIYFHPTSLSMEDFYNNCIPQECLPEEYDGCLPTVEVLHVEYAKKCLDMKTFFQAEEAQRNKE